MLVIPLGWAAKAALVTLNPRGRQAVSAIAGDAAWRRIALARLPVALTLALLTTRLTWRLLRRRAHSPVWVYIGDDLRDAERLSGSGLPRGNEPGASPEEAVHEPRARTTE
jgi:hypothetical protein